MQIHKELQKTDYGISLIGFLLIADTEEFTLLWYLKPMKGMRGAGDAFRGQIAVVFVENQDTRGMKQALRSFRGIRFTAKKRRVASLFFAQ